MSAGIPPSNLPPFIPTRAEMRHILKMRVDNADPSDVKEVDAPAPEDLADAIKVIIAKPAPGVMGGSTKVAYLTTTNDIFEHVVNTNAPPDNDVWLSFGKGPEFM